MSIDRDAKKAQHTSAIRELEKKKEAKEAAIEAVKVATLAATVVVPSAIVTNPTPAKEGGGGALGDQMDVDEL